MPRKEEVQVRLDVSWSLPFFGHFIKKPSVNMALKLVQVIFHCRHSKAFQKEMFTGCECETKQNGLKVTVYYVQL